MKIATRYLVRPMRLEDIPQVLEIERESFPTMWPPTAFKRELQQNRLAHYIVVAERNERAALRMAEQQEERQGGTFVRFLDEIKHIFQSEAEEPPLPPEERPELIVGVVGVWMMPDEAHIVTIATRGTHRRRGIGEMLLIKAIELAQERGQEAVTLEVRISNGPAIAMYEKYGFLEVGRRKRYYSDNGEDAHILTVNDVLTDEFAERFANLVVAHHARHGEFDGE
jgi:ribosomal-protein-alanine N-acetyltransferase